jgi:hypothetical protein
MMEEDEGLVCVFDYLKDAGFDTKVAAEITLAAVLRSVALTVDEIQVAAEAVGYSLPSTVPAIDLLTYKHRN